MNLQSFATATRKSTLPDGWSPLELVEDKVSAGGLSIYRAGVASVGPDGEEVTGAAADTSASPAARCRYELLERVSLLEAIRSRRERQTTLTLEGRPCGTVPASEAFPESDQPSRWQYARSNGVAIHRDWGSACARARLELAERDRVLRSWYGETTPIPLPRGHAKLLEDAGGFDVAAYSFPLPPASCSSASFSQDVEVVGVFAFPRSEPAPLIMGFAGRANLTDAAEAATLEALQGLAFLWGESPPASAPRPGPTAGHHLELFQWPGRRSVVRQWLEGAHRRHDRAARRTRESSGSATFTFIDLTPTWLGGGLRVVKALCGGAIPLTFGDSPFAAHLPIELRAHPIA
jgi:ribosomal protein S12 methylthiotransferase accessory factor YcaO